MWDKVLLIFAVTVLKYYVSKKVLSNEHSKVKFYFYFSIFYIVGSFVAFFIWPFFLLRPLSVQNSKVGANILKHITKLYGVQWELRNGDVLAEDRGAVIISNHQSSLDILGMFNIWNVVDKLAVIAKKEIFYVWPFGLAAYLAGVVFIDRNNTKDAYHQLKVTSEVMVTKKTKLWLFPEGTRNKVCDKLLPFKKGAFSIAVAAQTPIIPVVFSPYYFINEKKHIFNKGHVIIQCLEPIPTKGLTMDDVPQLIQRIHSLMEDTYKDLTKKVLNTLPPGYPHSLNHSDIIQNGK